MDNNKEINDDDELSMDVLEENFENLGLAIEPNVILRIIDICRRNNVQKNQTVIQFAQNIANRSIDNTFADEFEDSLKESDPVHDDEGELENNTTATVNKDVLTNPKRMNNDDKEVNNY